MRSTAARPSTPSIRYIFPNLRSGTGTTAIEVNDDETADAISIESGVGTLVQKCGNTTCTVAYDDPTDPSPFPSADWYTIRLTKQPNGQVKVAILTDGMVDVAGINGVATPVSGYEVIGGLVASRLFLGNIAISADGSTITRANGSDLGSFIDEGFERRNLIRVAITVAASRTLRPRDRRFADRGHREHDHAEDGAPAAARGYVGTTKDDTVSLLLERLATGKVTSRS